MNTEDMDIIKLKDCWSCYFIDAQIIINGQYLNTSGRSVFVCPLLSEDTGSPGLFYREGLIDMINIAIAEEYFDCLLSSKDLVSYSGKTVQFHFKYINTGEESKVLNFKNTNNENTLQILNTNKKSNNEIKKIFIYNTVLSNTPDIPITTETLSGEIVLAGIVDFKQHNGKLIYGKTNG